VTVLAPVKGELLILAERFEDIFCKLHDDRPAPKSWSD
jgi:hypothetical protein